MVFAFPEEVTPFAKNPLVGVVDPHLCLASLTVSPKSTEFPADAMVIKSILLVSAPVSYTHLTLPTKRIV